MTTRVRPNLEASEIHDSIVNDFESAWDALAARETASGRGNFMFGRQAMALLEWASRLCASDAGGGTLLALSNALAAIDPRYFTALPGVCALPGRDFLLPSRPGSEPGAQLLWAMFDLIRHGQAHQYQQITADLIDGHWVKSLTGAVYGHTLEKAAAQRSEKHLGFGRVDDTVFILVQPEVLFLDFKAAIRDAGLLSRDDLQLVYLTRGSSRQGLYAFDTERLDRFLDAGGHVRVGIEGVTRGALD